MNLYARLLRPLFFRLDPETAHHLAMMVLRLLAAAGGRAVPPERGPVELFGLRFANPIGLAAGFDKNGEALGAWPRLGFGHAEIGTVTALPQPGNPRPRLFRYPRERAVVNRMGFNNEGAAALALRLQRLEARGRRPRIPLGINLGKSRATPLEEAPGDYAASFRQLASLGDYFVVNVSSPNTPGLRDLQAVGALRGVLRAVRRENPMRRPVLVKIAPDLSEESLMEVAVAAEEEGAAGLVATNTTLNHSALPVQSDQTGGLSGRPLRARSTEVVRILRRATALPLIGVGGVEDAASAHEKIAAGASLVQLYTALVFAGPFVARRIVRELAAG